jgi:hypothetical protein
MDRTDNTSYKTIGGRQQAVQDERLGANGLPDGSGTLELRSLADMGITSIDYNNNTYTKADGSKKAIQTVQLEAQAEGTRYTPVKGGIKIETGTGNPEIIITQVISEAATYDTQGFTLQTAGGRNQAGKEKYSQKRSGLCPYDNDIGVKKPENRGRLSKTDLQPRSERACARIRRHEKQIIQGKKWQCQRHMVIVRYLINSSVCHTFTFVGAK